MLEAALVGMVGMYEVSFSWLDCEVRAMGDGLKQVKIEAQKQGRPLNPEQHDTLLWVLRTEAERRLAEKAAEERAWRKENQ